MSEERQGAVRCAEMTPAYVGVLYLFAISLCFQQCYGYSAFLSALVMMSDLTLLPSPILLFLCFALLFFKPPLKRQ